MMEKIKINPYAGIMCSLVFLLFSFGGYAQEGTVNHKTYSEVLLHPVYYLIFFLAIFSIGVGLFAILKRKEDKAEKEELEKTRKKTKMIKQAHFLRHKTMSIRH